MLLSLLPTAGLVGGAVAVGVPRGDVVRREPGPLVDRTSVIRPAARALAVLGDWDRRRAAAWAADDPSALRALYLPGSSTGRRDLEMLAAYHRRDLRVTTMQRQVLVVRVRPSRPRSLRLVVTDRLAEARVTGSRARVVLPRSRPATRTIVLRRGGTGWRVVEVYVDRASPAASTAATSRSRNS